MEIVCAQAGRVRKRLGKLGRGDRLQKKQQCGSLTGESLLQLCFERAPQKMLVSVRQERPPILACNSDCLSSEKDGTNTFVLFLHHAWFDSPGASWLY